jgi:hypothetical protein
MRRLTFAAVLMVPAMLALSSSSASAFGWYGYGYGYRACYAPRAYGYAYRPLYYRSYFRPRFAYGAFYRPRIWGGRTWGWRGRRW